MWQVEGARALLLISTFSSLCLRVKTFYNYEFRHNFQLLHLRTTPKSSVPEFIDPVFAKTSPKRSFSVIQNERFGLVFAKTGSIISGTGDKATVPIYVSVFTNVHWLTFLWASQKSIFHRHDDGTAGVVYWGEDERECLVWHFDDNRVPLLRLSTKYKT